MRRLSARALFSRQPVLDIQQPSIQEHVRERQQLTERELDLGEETVLNKLDKILKKDTKFHAPYDKHIISTFIAKNYFFQLAASKISYKFAKDLLQTSKIVCIANKQTIGQEDQIITKIGIVLDGKLNIYCRKEPEWHQKPEVFQQTHNLWKEMIERAQKNVKKWRKTSTSKLEYNQEFVSDPETMNQHNLVKEVSKDHLFGFYDYFFNSQRFMYTYIADQAQPTRILLFDPIKLLAVLDEALRWDKKCLAHKLRQIQCFSVLEPESMSAIVGMARKRHKKRGDPLYRQGQCAFSIFVLESGEVSLFKSAKLFEQNPNQLFSDRKQLVQENYHLTKSSNEDFPLNRHQKLILNNQLNKSALPYADFKTMYNYIPRTKNIDIGIITPFCLFGVEELISNKCRESSAVCQSLHCCVYEIDIDKFREISGQKAHRQFLCSLKNMLRKKILFMQAQFAKNLQICNMNNFKYFYVDENNKAEEASMRLKLMKINNKIQDSLHSSPQKPAIKSKGSKLVKQCSGLITHRRPVAPSYNKFNFETIVQKSLKRKSKSTPRKNMVWADLKISERNPQEIRMMDRTHTWNLIGEKVAAQSYTSKKLSPSKHRITLNDPLFPTAFVLQMEKKTKKLQRNMKTRKALEI